MYIYIYISLSLSFWHAISILVVYFLAAKYTTQLVRAILETHCHMQNSTNIVDITREIRGIGIERETGFF